MTSKELPVAFDAMRIFLEDYWKRGNKSSDDIAVLLGSLGRSRDGLPMDVGLWDDWQRAYRKAKSTANSAYGDPE